MRYFDHKFVPPNNLHQEHHRLSRSYILALSLIGLLALASLGLLAAQIDSQGRYARMINLRETQRVLTLRAALFSLLLTQEPSLPKREQYRGTIRESVDEIERTQRLLPAPGAPTDGFGSSPDRAEAAARSRDDLAAANLAVQLRRFIASEHAVLAGAANPSALEPSAAARLESVLAAAPSSLRDAFDDAIESQHGASLRQTRLYQALATGAVCLLLLTLVAEARWIFGPLVRAIRQEGRALADSRQRLGAVLDAVGEAILVADSENVIQTANAEAARVWGWPAEDLPGRKLNTLVLAGRDLTPHLWRAMFPAAGRLETVGTRQNGEPFGLELSLTSTSVPAVPLERYSLWQCRQPPADLLPQDRVLYTISARDITARLEAARALAGARDAALDAARSKGAFVASMSHEMRAPLDALRSQIARLAESSPPPGQLAAIEQIRHHADALGTVLEDLLDVSNIESGRLILNQLDFDLRELIEGVADVVAGRAVQKQLELLAYVEPNVPAALRGDPARLRQVLLNLLSNALKFTRQGEVIVRVALESEESGHAALRFSVRDTGIGVAEEQRAHLFHHSAASSGSEDTPGAVAGAHGHHGFGLMICRQLVECMHGTIDMENESAGGSTFWFTVRLEKQPAGSRRFAGAGPGQGAADLLASLRDVHVLVVDDNATSRDLVSARLGAWGMQSATADSGGTALAQLREQALAGTPFEIALLDLNLGSMDGFTLAWSIHSQPLLAATRIVLMTALGLENDRTACRHVGIVSSVSKPLKHDALLRVLAEAANEDNPVVPTTASSRPARAPVRTNRILSLDAPLQTGGNRILLADDNPINRKMALRQLANLGFPADAVGNGREALAALRAQSYGMVLLDVHMPVMDGYETAQTIRRLLRDRPQDQLALIAMTANRTAGDRERCLSAGMDDYLSKPVRQEELASMLERWEFAPKYEQAVVQSEAAN